MPYTIYDSISLMETMHKSGNQGMEVGMCHLNNIPNTPFMDFWLPIAQSWVQSVWRSECPKKECSHEENSLCSIKFTSKNNSCSF